jgi:branched-subunit amino acid aminotransferase/4-amino-4-deoxychorismate lyase
MIQMPLAYVGGRFLPVEQATVPVNDAGVLEGVGVYETLRTYGGRPFRLKAHLQRLHKSAGFLDIPIAEPDDHILGAVMRLVEINKTPDARVRITLTAGPHDGELSADPPSGTLIVTATPLVPYAPALYEQGAKVVIASARVKELDPLTLHKTTCRIRQFLALRSARRAGAAEAIFLNTLGRVAEGAISNIFIVQGDHVLTPPIEEGLMPGITRAAILEVARAAGIVAQEHAITSETLHHAGEVMITNSIMEVMPVVHVDQTPIADGRPGPMTRRLAEVYKDLVRRETQGK